MRIIFTAFLLTFLSVSLIGQNNSGEFTANHEGWLVDLDTAYAQSQKTGKPILANFTGSDWCGWCKKLSRAVFVKDEFKKWAEENVVLLELDFPKRRDIPKKYKKQNANLQRAFKVRGFPSVYVFTMSEKSSGKYSINAFGKTGYTSSVNQFISRMDEMIKKGMASSEKESSSDGSE